ncbi:hypothetical protein KI387_030392 [Taxus chinensis]|uniref:ATP synthase subunit O, mitochondrial n=1 Tax=Taxus chinensis TaxID=29808 RepID=A0AA38CET5_TAXCH|nr:hypothetical protein KI387_030392 [Taxus chinensis]
MTMIRRAFQFSRMLTTAAAPTIRSPMPALSQPSISPSPLFQVARNYSTGEQLKEADIQVPLPMFGVTGNYASALYIAALKADKLDDVETELKSVIDAAKGSPAFQSFMKNLSVPSKIRVKAMQEIFGEAGFSEITKNFLAVAAEHGRLRLLESIVNKFTRLTMAYYGEVNAIVTTVIPLPVQEEEELKQALANILGEGKTVTLEQKIDRNILGGLVVEYEDKLLDMSIRTRLKQMENSLLSEPVELL